MSFNLNEQQLQIVTHSGGPQLVVAVPGSGKTRVIVERIIYLIGQGLKPSEILCLTFSEKAADEMKERLDKITDVSDMHISTFHSFCFEIGRAHV